MSGLTHTIGRDQTLSEASSRMREFGIRHLAVLHAGKMIGIVSNRDIALVESLPGVDATLLEVHEAMTPEPYTVPPDAPLSEVLRTMAERKYGATLVVDNGALVGIFTTTDALRLAYDLL